MDTQSQQQYSQPFVYGDRLFLEGEEGVRYAATLPAGQIVQGEERWEEPWGADSFPRSGKQWVGTQGHILLSALSYWGEVRYWHCSCGARHTTGGIDNAAGGSGTVVASTAVPWDAFHRSLARAYATGAASAGPATVAEVEVAWATSSRAWKFDELR